MANTLSRLLSAIELWSFKYNCYEAVHPWTPYCTDSALDLGLTVFGEAFKLYTPLYLFSQIVQRRYDVQSFIQTLKSILRSTTFISVNAFFALLFFCSSQHLTGKFYYYAVAYVPAFLASSMAVMVEKPSRRSSLAFYVANVASETLFRISVARGRIRSINNGQVYIFTVAMATIMMLAKLNGFDDDPLSAAIKLVVGSEEARKGRRSNRGDRELTKLQASPSDDTTTQSWQDPERSEPLSVECKEDSDQETLVDRVMSTMRWLRSLLQAKHHLCPHQISCVHYTTRAAIRALLIGYSVQLSLKLAARSHQIIKTPQLILELATDRKNMALGMFLGAFSGLFKGANCSFRWAVGRSNASTCFMAALVAGPALGLYPSPTVALYVLWKCLEALFNEAVKREVIKNKDLFVVGLYGLATSQLFYSALMDPRYMKTSYMAFLDRISKHKLHLINRSVLDVFGTESSSGYEQFFPDLHPKYMSRAFIGSIWIWMIEQKFPFTQVTVAQL